MLTRNIRIHKNNQALEINFHSYVVHNQVLLFVNGTATQITLVSIMGQDQQFLVPSLGLGQGPKGFGSQARKGTFN